MEENKYQNPLKLALLLLFIGVAVAIHQFKIPPIMVQVAGSMGAGEDKAAGLMSVFLLICLIFSLPAGNLIEIVDTKKVLLLSAAVISSGATVGIFSRTYPVLLFSRGIEGVGFLLLSIAIPVAASKYSDPRKIGFVTGIAGIWVSVGSIIAFNTVPFLNRLLGWKGVWLVFIVFTVSAIFIFGSLFKAEARLGIELSNSGGKSTGYGEAIKNKDLLIGAFGFFVFNVNLFAMITFFPMHSTQSGLFDIDKAAFIASLPMILSLVSSPTYGRLADKVGHKWLYCIAVLCSGIGAWMMFSGSVGIIMMGALILGLVGVASPPLIFSSINRLIVDQQLLAKSNSLVVFFQNGGMFLATFAFGKLVVALGGNYSKAGLFLLPLSILAAVLILRINYNKNEIGA